MKFKEFEVVQMIVVSFLDEHLTVKLITTTRERIEQMNQDLTALTASYTKINTEIWNAVKLLKDDEGGSGMTHK